MTHKLLIGWTAFTAVCLVVLLAGTLWFYVLDTPTPIAYRTLPLTIDKAVYHAGEDVLVTAHICRYSTASSTGAIQIQSTDTDRRYILPTRYAPANPNLGCADSTVPVPLPSPMEPGSYYLLGSRAFQVNQFATRVVPWHSVEFRVVEKE